MRTVSYRTFLSILFFSASALAACGDNGSTSNQGGNAGSGNGGKGGTAASGAGTNTGGGGGTAGGNTNSGGSGGASTTSMGTGAGPLIEVPCQNQTYECGDTIDNDGDGLSDWEDPDCLGPCDNTENSYFGGIPGQTGPKCFVDCYWDNDSGSGNDDCFWDHRCDPNELNGHPEPIGSCPYDENANISGTVLGCAELKATQSATCAAVCGPLTPNGCDCFGCCELPAGTGKFVWVGSYLNGDSKTGTCAIADVNDPDKCEPCLPVPSCYNDCGPCELCIGKTEADLPPECFMGQGGGGNGAGGNGSGGGATLQCPNGQQPCGLNGQDVCGPGYYCITGCCQPIQEPQ